MNKAEKPNHSGTTETRSCVRGSEETRRVVPEKRANPAEEFLSLIAALEQFDSGIAAGFESALKKLLRWTQS